jgi:pilus assembly protein CpaB
MVCEQFERTQEGAIVCTNEGTVEQGRVITVPELGTPLYVRPIESQRPRLVTQRLVQYATVLHVGTFALPEEETAVVSPVPVEEVPVVGAPAGETGAVVEEAARPPDIVTLVVTPQDALAINWAVKAGLDLALTLRAPGDTAQTTTSSVTLQYLLETYGITVPSKQPYGVQPAPGEPVKPVLPNDIPLPTPTPQR